MFSPAWRPDKSLHIGDPHSYNIYIAKLEAAAGLSAATYSDLLTVLRKRHQFFHDQGCRVSDYGLNTVYCEHTNLEEVSKIFQKVREGEVLYGSRSARLSISAFT